MDYSAILQAIIPIAKGAGDLLRTQFYQPIQQTTKSSATDIVTETDKQSEAYISAELLRLFPTHHLVGEEGGGQGAPEAEADGLWFVDPIDGTVNFAHGIPHFCVSIALTDRQRRSLVGVVYDPMRDELYSATLGGGAYLNGRRLQVSSAPDVLHSVFSSGFAYDSHFNADDNTKQWASFVKQGRGVRRFGSAALDLAYIAAGRYDGYWERSLKPWDVMAGVLLVTEAGGKVTDYEGGDSPQWGKDGRYIASNGIIHADMVRILQASYAS